MLAIFLINKIVYIAYADFTEKDKLCMKLSDLFTVKCIYNITRFKCNTI